MTMARANGKARTRTAPAPDPAEPGLWFYSWKIWMEARRRLDEALEPLGLRGRDVWLLAIAGKGDLSQHEMAAVCGMDPSTLVPVLDGLEKRGWLRRERNPEDRRMQWVRRTEAGDELFHRALPLARRAEEQHLAALSPAHQRRLVAAMRKLVDTQALLTKK